ncbi:hypothetical protein [Henriciella sp.]|uniref:hypothetical protein n=1 Tax=Henriciella sp. TaxID=1968823 RepID=UPI0026194F49|nr:hypothetical protein [Henriciella sp.]
MKTAMFAGLVSGAALILTACGQSSEEKSEMFSQCKLVMGDMTLNTDLRAAGTTPDAVCTCLGATLKDDGDDREDIQAFFAKVSERMEETDENAREAVDKLVSGSLLPEDGDGDADESFADILSSFNEVMNEMLTEMGENDGVCPAV